jgi:hypothetical protein
VSEAGVGSQASGVRCLTIGFGQPTHKKRLTAKVAKNSREGRKENQKSLPAQTASMRCISLRTEK